jgi:hypothetical protein
MPMLSASSAVDWVEAGQAAQAKCRDSAARHLEQIARGATAGDWQDQYVAGLDERGFSAARVEGVVRANKSDGTFELHHYDCSLSGYDARSGTWSAMSIVFGKVS